MMLRFHVLTTICALFVLPVFSHKARQPKEDDFGLESCKFLDNIAYYNQGKIFFPDGVLITGTEYPHMGTAELYLPSSNVSCSIPLFGPCRAHTVESSGLLCGGWFYDSCWQWSPDTGTWEEGVNLFGLHQRYFHSSWTPVSGVGTYLMGGEASPRTTTLLTPDGTQEPGFQLKYDT